jgi:hypothetical protein
MSARLRHGRLAFLKKMQGKASPSKTDPPSDGGEKMQT